jgi:nucleotide-binding universal stress UspA family protein
MDGEGAMARRLVVLADDGQPASDIAWAWLIGHRWDGFELRTLTARWTLFGVGAEVKPSRFVPRTPPQEAAFSGSSHLEVSGDPRVVLLDQADAELLVLGSHRRSHLSGLWAGSAAEWLLVRPPTPMVLVQHGHATESVVLCVDGSEHALFALRTFIALPWTADVSVTLAAVDDGRTDVEQSLVDADAALTAHGRTPAGVARLQGAPGPALSRFVADHRIDLAVMGTRGLTGWARMRVGSAVSRLLKDGAANLLIAHVPVAEPSEG